VEALDGELDVVEASEFGSRVIMSLNIEARSDMGGKFPASAAAAEAFFLAAWVRPPAAIVEYQKCHTSSTMM
jgi:hypothetical protein